MRPLWLFVLIFSMIIFTPMVQVSLAGENKVLQDPEVNEAISLIRKEYIHEVDVESLERHCIDTLQKASISQSPVDVCLAGMVSSLDPYSSYLDPNNFRAAIKEQNEIVPVTFERLFNGEVGYIGIRRFPEKIKDQIRSAVAGMVKENPPIWGLIIDLRDNPGGALIYPIGVAELFLSPPGVISEVNGRNKMKFEIPRYERLNDKNTVGTLKSAPLVVLVNGETARGAELVAAALRENGRAKIIGTETAKRGDVQTVVSLKSKKAMKLTSGYLVAPNGRRIDEDGVTIDIEVGMNSISTDLEKDAVVLKAYTELKAQHHQETNRTSITLPQTVGVFPK